MRFVYFSYFPFVFLGERFVSNCSINWILLLYYSVYKHIILLSVNSVNKIFELGTCGNFLLLSCKPNLEIIRVSVSMYHEKHFSASDMMLLVKKRNSVNHQIHICYGVWLLA